MRLALATVALAACNASTGTLTLQLATAPGSTLLSSIERVELTLTNPPAVFEAERTDDGLDIAFEIEAVETDGSIYIQGFDANDATVAVGQSPPFPLGGSDGRVIIYVAPPYSILQAPVDLLPPRSLVGGSEILYGAALAGGVDADGVASTSMVIYNIYDHTVSEGEEMPVARVAPTLAANDFATIYVAGGLDENGAATSTLFRFQSNIAPRGSYSNVEAYPGLESSGERAIQLGPDTFFVTGAQPALLAASTMTPITSLADVPPTATAALTAAGEPVAVFVREGTVGFYDANATIGEVTLPSVDTGRAIVAGNEQGTVIVVGGSSREAIVVSLASQSAVARADVLSVARRSPTVAATARHILVANGVDENGAVIGTADILDRATLALITTVPLDPRLGAVALPMPNDQILIAGGEYPGDVANGLIELFTPPAP